MTRKKDALQLALKNDHERLALQAEWDAAADLASRTAKIEGKEAAKRACESDRVLPRYFRRAFAGSSVPWPFSIVFAWLESDEAAYSDYYWRAYNETFERIMLGFGQTVERPKKYHP